MPSLSPLKKILLALDDKSTPEDVLHAFQDALLIIATIETATEKEIAELKRDATTLAKAYEEAIQIAKDDTKLKTLKEQFNDAIERLEARVIPTNEDIKELARSVIPLPPPPQIINQIVEKAIYPSTGEWEAMIRPLIPTLPPPQITEIIKEVAVKDTPEEIRDKLETLKDDTRLDKSAIKGLEDEIKKLREEIASIPRGGGGGVVSREWFFVVLTGELDGVNTSFGLGSATFRTIFLFLNGQLLRKNTDYTIGTTTITTTFAPTGGSLYAWCRK